MTKPASPRDVGELLQFMTSFVRDRFDKTGCRTTGAALAEEIRQHFPDFTFGQLGFARLAEAVQCAEEAGGLVRHRDVTHLEVSPSQCTPRSSTSRRMSTSSLYVRPDVWRAFVFITESSAHFLDRTTGRLVTLKSDRTEQVEALERDPRFAQIKSIAPEVQKNWMRQFVLSQESLVVDDAPINDERWWIAFPTWLQELDAANILGWRRFRAEKVVSIVGQWAKENDVSHETLFSPPRQLPLGSAPGGRPAEDEATKRAVIAAIEDRSIEVLEDVPIPVRYILRHFRPR